MAAKNQRTVTEFKAISPWSQLPSALRREISKLIPGSIAGAGRYESKLARDYRSNLCGPDRAPQVRQRQFTPDAKYVVRTASKVSPLICPHHPLVPPIQFNGPLEPPCCLPLKLESPADWEQMFHLTKFGMSLVILDGPNGKVTLPTHVKGWEKLLLNYYYPNAGSIDTVEFAGNVVTNYQADEFRNDDWKTFAIYQRNPDNNVMTAAWPSVSLRPDGAMPIDPEWYIASDDEDKDVESQIIKYIEDEYWKNQSTSKEIQYLTQVAKMSTLYGRDSLAKSLSDELARLVKYRTVAGKFVHSDDDDGSDDDGEGDDGSEED